jgi:AbrB family looped-hinge helix DNA binding protein
MPGARTERRSGPHSYRVEVGDKGRIVLPAEVRRELGYEPGTRLLLTVEDETVVLRSQEAGLRSLRGMLADLPGGTWSGELIGERAAEHAREQER